MTIPQLDFEEESNADILRFSHQSQDDVPVEDTNEDDNYFESSRQNEGDVRNEEKIENEPSSSCHDSSSENENVEDDINLTDLDELLDAGNNPFLIYGYNANVLFQRNYSVEKSSRVDF